jgi:hypothetical protein
MAAKLMPWPPTTGHVVGADFVESVFASAEARPDEPRNPVKLRSIAWLDAFNPALYTSAVLSQTIDLNRRAGTGIISRNEPCPGVAT